MLKKIAGVVSLVFAATLLIAMPTTANGGGPSLSSVAPTSGTVSGGTAVTLTGTSFTGATSVTIGGVAATDFTVVSDTSITATTPLRSSISRKIGRYPVVVTYSGGTSSETVYCDYAPDFEPVAIGAPETNTGLVTLGDLASRSQGKSIVRNASTPPLTVTGTDSNTGEHYSYIFEREYPSDFTGYTAYDVEAVETALDFSQGVDFTTE